MQYDDPMSNCMSFTFTYDEIHAFSEHVTWNIYEQDQPVDEHLQSFIDKILYSEPVPD
tara:strand:+ start:636 stop:809 length:174 start_codon:yes stop_codon:yes gene_type:complete